MKGLIKNVVFQAEFGVVTGFLQVLDQSFIRCRRFMNRASVNLSVISRAASVTPDLNGFNDQ